MRVVRSAPALVLAWAACALSACKAPSPSTIASADGGATAAPVADDSAQVLARVGEHTITLGDFLAALEHMDQFDRLRYQAPERRKELLHEMIDVMLLADEARARGYDQDPETQEELRQILRDAVIRSARQAAPAPNDIAPEEVAAYYNAHKEDFHDPERRRISAVVLAHTAAASAVLEVTRKAAEKADASPSADGRADVWGDLVRTRSIDPQGATAMPPDLAGDLGFTSPPGDPRGVNPRIPEEVRAAAFEIARPGDVLPRVVEAKSPADGSSRFYVIKLVAKVDGHDRSLADAERSIRVKLAEEKANASEAALLDDLRKQYPVRIDESALAEVHADAPHLDAGPP